MYLKGSKWNMRRRRGPRPNLLRISFWVVLIVAVWYFNQVIVPTIPPPFVSTPTATRSPESFVNEAQLYFTEGKFSQAINAYKQAILSDPENPTYYIEVARIQIYSSLYQEAKTSAENALLLNPNNANALAIKGWAEGFLKEFDEAQVSLEKALKIDPNNAAAYAYYVEVLLDQGVFEDIEKAIGMSQKAQSLAPNSMETHRARGYVLYVTANYEEAIQEYKAAIAINERIWDLHYSLGILYRVVGEFDLAQQEMLAAIAFNPNNPDIPTDLSRSYANQGQFGKAVQYAQQALKIDPSSPKLHGNLGFMYYKNNEYDNAVEELNLAVRGGTTVDGVVVQGLPLAPGRVADEYYSFYGLALAKTGQCSQAVSIFQFILQNIAEDQTAAYNANEGIAYCQDKTGAASP
jgi:tetratricopeptide (TPR) repeat protein